MFTIVELLTSFILGRHHVHLDCAATTPVHPSVLRAMEPYWNRVWANPSAIYGAGVRARAVVEESRTKVARLLRVRADGVVFTSGGTESINLALLGYVAHLHKSGRAYKDIEIVTTAIEHPSITRAVEVLRDMGVMVTFAPVDENGRIDVGVFQGMLSARTALVSFAYVNSEIGVVQDVKRITRAVRAANKTLGTNIVVHLDGAQAPLWLPCEMDMLGVDFLSLDSGKCYGPKGVGVLAMRHGVRVAPTMYGGEQEGGMRAGTENVPLIVGCTEALIRAQQLWKSRADKVCFLRNFMLDKLLKDIPKVTVNGSREHRVANNVNISIPGIDTEFAVIVLDKHGIAASTRSACGTGEETGSHVVREITHDENRARSTIRFTLGETTTQHELEVTISVLTKHVEEMRTFLGSLNPVV